MANQNSITTRYHYEFIHNVVACFYKDTLDYLTEQLQPRFQHKLISTYHKAVEYLRQLSTLNGREMDKPNLPALILNPSGDFGISESGGKQFHRFINLSPAFVKRLYYPIYQDENMIVTPGFSRIKGEIELICLLNSVYEYCDIRFLFLQFFGGMDRLIYPRYFSTFIVIPDELYNYRYENEYTGVSYTINWASAGAYQQLVKSTNREEYVYPVTIYPWYKLTGLTDASTKYGGTDHLSDWRLSATLEYEVEVPSYLILESDYLAENLKLNLISGSVYSNYPSYQPPLNRSITKFHWGWGLDSTSSASSIDYDATSSIEYTRNLLYKNRYYHVITQQEADSTSNVDINIPEAIEDVDYILVNSRYGLLNYGDHYLIVNNGSILRIKVSSVDLTSGQVIELYTYAEDPGTVV